MKILSAGSRHTVLYVVFDEKEFIAYEKRRAFDFDDLLASVGGFMGLILGISLVSIVEVLYFIIFKSGGKASEEDQPEKSNENIFKITYFSYGNSSSIHGFNHVFDQDGSVLKK
jgi:Amiloride-sensitive sodium channel